MSPYEWQKKLYLCAKALPLQKRDGINMLNETVIEILSFCQIDKVLLATHQRTKSLLSNLFLIEDAFSVVVKIALKSCCCLRDSFRIFSLCLNPNWISVYSSESLGAQISNDHTREVRQGGGGGMLRWHTTAKIPPFQQNVRKCLRPKSMVAVFHQ